MLVLEHHVLHLHEADLRRTLVLIKLHRDRVDQFLRLRDRDMLKGVYTTSRFLDGIGHELAALLDLCKPEKIRQNLGETLHRIIEIG